MEIYGKKWFKFMMEGKECVRIQFFQKEKARLCCEIVLISQQGIKESLLHIKTAQLLVYKNWCVRK